MSGRSFDRQPWEKLDIYPIPTWMATGKSGDPQSTVLLTHWSHPNFSQLYTTQQNASVDSYSSTPTSVQPKPKYLIPHPQFPVERWSSGESTPDIQLLDAENTRKKVQFLCITLISKNPTGVVTPCLPQVPKLSLFWALLIFLHFVIIVFVLSAAVKKTKWEMDECEVPSKRTKTAKSIDSENARTQDAVPVVTTNVMHGQVGKFVFATKVTPPVLVT